MGLGKEEGGARAGRVGHAGTPEGTGKHAQDGGQPLARGDQLGATAGQGELVYSNASGEVRTKEDEWGVGSGSTNSRAASASCSTRSTQRGTPTLRQLQAAITARNHEQETRPAGQQSGSPQAKRNACLQRPGLWPERGHQEGGQQQQGCRARRNSECTLSTHLGSSPRLLLAQRQAALLPLAPTLAAGQAAAAWQAGALPRSPLQVAWTYYRAAACPLASPGLGGPAGRWVLASRLPAAWVSLGPPLTELRAMLRSPVPLVGSGWTRGLEKRRRGFDRVDRPKETEEVLAHCIKLKNEALLPVRLAQQQMLSRQQGSMCMKQCPAITCCLTPFSRLKMSRHHLKGCRRPPRLADARSRTLVSGACLSQTALLASPSMHLLALLPSMANTSRNIYLVSRGMNAPEASAAAGLHLYWSGQRSVPAVR